MAELQTDFQAVSEHHAPAAVLCAVGGGGLLNGVCRGLQGLQGVTQGEGWQDVQV